MSKAFLILLLTHFQASAGSVSIEDSDVYKTFSLKNSSGEVFKVLDETDATTAPGVKLGGDTWLCNDISSFTLDELWQYTQVFDEIEEIGKRVERTRVLSEEDRLYLNNEVPNCGLFELMVQLNIISELNEKKNPAGNLTRVNLVTHGSNKLGLELAFYSRSKSAVLKTNTSYKSYPALHKSLGTVQNKANNSGQSVGFKLVRGGNKYTRTQSVYETETCRVSKYVEECHIDSSGEEVCEMVYKRVRGERVDEYLETKTHYPFILSILSKNSANLAKYKFEYREITGERVLERAGDCE